MSKNGMASLEALLAEAGIDVAAMKTSIDALDEAFGGEAGDIPEGALSRWVNEHVDHVKAHKFFILIGRMYEAQIELPEGRKWEKGPNAAAMKAKMNLEKQKAKK